MTDPHLETLARRYPALAPLCPEIGRAFEIIAAALTAGKVLYLCGNGGSAADCEHIAGELLKGFLLPRHLGAADAEQLRAAAPAPAEAAYLTARLQGGLRAEALTGHPSLTSAVANDLGADLIFAQQVWALGSPGDVLLAISTSGDARNVLLAAVAARARQMRVIGLTGTTGGRLKEAADVCLCVPETETYKVQELHLPLYHALCAMLEARFFGHAEPA